MNISSNSGSARAEAALQQPDGKIIAAGYASNGGSTDFALARFNADGSLDAGFGNRGTVVTPIGTDDDFGWAVALQGDGKIVVAGYATVAWTGGSQLGFAAARYLANGALDETFGNGGKVLIAMGEPDAFGPKESKAYAVAIQSDGKILLAGQRYRVSPYYGDELVMVRLLSDGSRDIGFGVAGKVVASLGEYDTNHGYALALQPDGRIVLAGRRLGPQWFNLAAFRFNADGTRDGSFGANGMVEIDLGRHAEVRAVLVQPDGKLVLVGPQGLARLKPSGALDTSFGAAGLAMIEGGRAAVLESDGKIAVAGQADTGTGQFHFLAFRLLPDGNLDQGFGTGGRVAIATGWNDWATGLVRTSMGNYVAIGPSWEGQRLAGQFTLMGYTASGLMDTNFGNRGVVYTSLGNSDDWFGDALAILPDGRLLMAGESFNVSNQSLDLALARFLPSGAPDTTFGNGGKLTLPLTPYNDGARAIAAQSDGKFVTAGYSIPKGFGNLDFLVTRHLPDGNLDASFGSGGVVAIDVAYRQDAAASMALRPDGRIIVGGTAWVNGNYHFTIVQLLPDGAFDASFGPGGFSVPIAGDAKKLALQDDGKIVVVGDLPIDTNYPGVTRVGMVRLNANGSLDTAFGAGGIIDDGISSGITGANTVLVLPDGRIVVGGRDRIGVFDYCMIRRYLANGTLDSAFGNGGKTVISTNCNQVNGLALQGDGKLVGTGVYQLSKYYPEDVPVFRLNADGSPDTRFGSGGVSLFRLGSLGDVGFAIRVLPGGNILVAGVSDDGASLDALLMRLVGTGSDLVPNVPAQLSATVISNTQIELAWASSTDGIAAATYRVYRDNKEIGTVPATTLSYSDTGLWPSTPYTYKVSACDAANNCSSPSASVSAATPPLGSIIVTHRLRAGWNLVGNSVNRDIDVMSFFGNRDRPVPGVTEKINAIWGWEPGSQRWWFYSPQLTFAGNNDYATAHNYMILNSIYRGQGYWVNAKEAFSLTVPWGNPIVLGPTEFAALPSGWNLVTTGPETGISPSAFNVLVSQSPPAALPHTIQTLWAWDAAQANWYFYSPLIASSSGLAGVKSYAESKGYLDFETAYPPNAGALMRLGLGVGFWVNKL